MKISRRSFLGMGGASALGSAVAMFGLPTPARAASFPEMKTLHTKETTTICPYCGVGCGLVVATRDGALVNIEGDADHPINEGALCSKGMSLYQVAKNDRRLDKVRYRAAGSSSWEEKSWDWAMKEIATRVKKTRDATFIANEGDHLVNRAHGLACLGGAALDNEECYMLAKFARGLGIAFVEHQARI
jgi:anaerobic selenocysteine-containing dehydrogenase